MKTYFILDTFRGAIKIGRSKNPEKRLRTLQTASAYELKLLVVLDGDHEKLMHKKWAEHRLHGEWFTATAEMRLFAHAKRVEQLEERERKVARLGGGHTIKPGATIPFERHVQVINGVYRKYRSATNQLAATVRPFSSVKYFLADCPSDRAVDVGIHKTLLQRAREYYAQQLSNSLRPDEKDGGAYCADRTSGTGPTDQSSAKVTIH